MRSDTGKGLRMIRSCSCLGKVAASFCGRQALLDSM